MPLFKDEAIVVRHIDYSETSQVLVAFTLNHGKVRLMAKGTRRSTRKRFSPGVDLLEIGRVVWSARSATSDGLSTLTEWKQTRGSQGLRESLDRLYAAMYAGEVTALLLVDGDPHPPLYQSLIGLLDQLADVNAVLPLLCAYQRRLLIEVGLMPRFECCVACGQAEPAITMEPLYFSAREGGVVCRDCEASHVEKRLIAPCAARAAASGQVQAFAAELYELFDYHITYSLGKPPRTTQFVRSAIRSGIVQ
jgi:DNA repair protein RecO (recombination protein O)